jgi:uncharacterized membrane protein YciS (DUF1049 family)
MKKFSIFLTVLLVILIASLIFVLQNNSTIVTLKFLGWSIPNVSAGLLSVIAFFAGFICMWLVSLILYAGSVGKYKKEIKSRDKLIKQLEEEKNSAKKELEELQKKYDADKAVLTNELEKAKKELEELKNKTSSQPVPEKTEKEQENKQENENTVKEETTKKRGFFGRKPK